MTEELGLEPLRRVRLELGLQGENHRPGAWGNVGELDGVGLVENRPSTDQLQLKKKYT